MKAGWFWMNMNVEKCGDEIWMDLYEYEHRLV